jgi:hypothetical protein
MSPSNKWSVQPSELVGVTPESARDLITRCFFEEQKETFAQADINLGHSPNDADLQNMIVGAIRLAFRETGYDYEHPTKKALTSVIEVLARKVRAWQTPPEIVAHHKEQIMKVLAHLPE